jgi:SAM-dependent methyltransferase
MTVHVYWKQMSDLSENSKSYGVESDIYQIFSEAEDYPGYIFEYLKNLMVNKSVLDLGCGNGKYSHLLYPFTIIMGADKSWSQVQRARQLTKYVNFIQADCMALPFVEKLDYVMCCWMLGTLIHPEKQQQALKEIKKTLKPQGKIILVENDINSDFEKIRGRDKDSRTQEYNYFLLSNGFSVIKEIDTYFQFENTEVANNTFKAIWGDKIQFELTEPRLNHRVLIFSN